MHKRISICLITLFILAGSLCVEAVYLVHEQGELPVLSYKASVEIKDQVAFTSLEMVFHNPSEQAVQAGLNFPISETAAIPKYSLTDGEGNVFTDSFIDSFSESNSSAEAFTVIDQEKQGFRLFKTGTINVAAGSRVTALIEYSELLPYRSGKTSYTLPFAIKEEQETELETASIHISIRDQKAIANVVSNWQNVATDKDDKGTWNVVFEQNKYLPEADFMLNYELKSATPSINFLATRPEIDQDGYFMLTFSPAELISDKDIAMHDIVFVIDTSASMSHESDEIKRLLSFFIKQLNASDRFGIIAFSTLTKTFMPELAAASEVNRQTAGDFVNFLNVHNNTDIHRALLTGLKLFDNAEGRTRTMILLTDGRTGVGIRDTDAIVRDCIASNTNGARIFALGIGHNINVELLKRLAAENRGEAFFPGHIIDYEKQMMDFYRSISTPVLVDVKLNMGSAEVSKVFPENLPPISHGSRLLIKGRYSKAASAEMTLTGTLNNVEHVFPINATFVEKSEDNLFIRQLWSKDNAGNRTQATAGAEPQLSDQNSVTARTFVRCSETRPLSFWGIYGFLPTIFALPLSRTRHNGGGHRACLANQRVLYGAIEMYNMDNNVMIDELDQETMDNLLKGQYLKSPMVMAKKECCFSITDALYSEDSIVCSVHGNSEIELEENSDQQTSDMFREGVYLEIIDKKQLVINKSEIIHEEDSWLKKTWNSWLADVVNLLINVPLFIIGLVLSFYLTYLILLLPFKLLAGLFELLSGKEK